MEEENLIERVIVKDLSSEMEKSYLNYSMSVIVARALPDVRDGLKPVHRRILYDMNELGIKSTGEFKKSARIVGDVLGKYHPHGDASVYDALVRLAQDFSLRYPVIKPHGNFGSIDGDPAAAMRYTEAKMSVYGEAMLDDIQKETVDFIDNYDGSMQEPAVLPSSIPFLLLNGSNGIAVGMATNMPPHNMGEVCDGIIAMIDNENITSEELMEYIKGPDFPTSCVIHGIKGIKSAFCTGRGRVTIRSRYTIEEHRTHTSIVFTEVPYQVNKTEVVKKINLLKKEAIKNIAEVRDETSEKEGIRIVIDLKKGAMPLVIVNQIYKSTDLQCNFSINNLALVKGRPQTLTLRDMIFYFLEHREDVVTRRTKFDLKKAQERAHILRGLKIGIDNIDEVIKIIKESKDNSIAQIKLMERFGLDDIQAKAIIDMRLGRLSNLETEEILNELKDLEAKISYYNELLADKTKLLGVIKDEILNIKNKFSDKRKTEIIPYELGEMTKEDFIKEEDVVITATRKGFLKRVNATDYKAQNRGGKGVKGVNLRNEDATDFIFKASTHDYILFMTNLGKAYFIKVHEIEDATKTGKGTSIRSLLQFTDDEDITAGISFKEFDENKTILMATKLGVLKRVKLYDYRNARTKGVIAISLDEGDCLKCCIFTDEEDEALIVSKSGKGLRFKVNSVRCMSRQAHGVKGLRLSNDDEIVGLVKVDTTKTALVITSKGQGKQVEYDEFTAHGRSTSGQRICRFKDDSDYIVKALSADAQKEDLMCITNFGQIIRMPVDTISQQGRNASGVRVFSLKKSNDYIVSITTLDKEMESEDSEENKSENEGGNAESNSTEVNSTESSFTETNPIESNTDIRDDTSNE